MKISFNPSNSNKNILDLIKNNKDIIFDLKGHSIFARGVEFKGTDTNTWRDIKINNVSIGSHTLDLQNGSNTTLTNTNGVVTINSTWRPVVDNLTSDSTTSSLSAKQGKVLKALIDGKSNSDHNHDGRYVRYYAVTTLDCNNLAAGLTAARISATNAAHTNHSAYLYISDVGTPFQIQIPDSSIPYIYKRYYGSGKWSGWFKLSAGYADSAGSVAWANVTGKPSAFNPAAHTHTVFKNNLMIKGTNGISDSASIHLGIGDSDTGFKWISDGVCQIYADNAAVGQWTSGGMDWFKNPTVNGNKVWNAGNDGSGSGLDSDLVDGLHASRFPIYYNLNMSSTSNHWYKLGTARISESDNIMIHIYSGNGWNSNAHQNAYATLMIKTGYNPNGGLTREFGATMVNHHHSNMTYKLISPSNSTVDIWVKIPWEYSSGWYSIHGEYSSYTHSGASQSAEPTGNAQTGVETLTNAYTSSNVASATKLATPRTIWGQSFDGTGNVSGSLSEVGNIHFKVDNSYDIGSDAAASRYIYTHWLGAKSGQKLELGANNSGFGQGLCIDTNLNVGIGTNTPTQKLDVHGNIRATGQIIREGSGQLWVTGRNGALLRETSAVGYHTLWSLKTTDGSWDFGEYNAGSDWNNIPVLSYITDSNYNSGNNATTYQIKFPLASGTVALTSNIPNPTNYYWANVKISASSSTTTSPTVHTLTATRVCAGHNPGIDNSISCSNWFRSSGNTGWYNTTYQGGWYMSDTSWIRAHNGVGIYTSGQIYSSSSIRMSNILLEYTDEINNSANGGIHLNYRNSGNVSLCYGGGNVGIGTTTPSYKLDVNGQMRASGFHHASVNSDNYMLLAGGGYKSFGGDDSTPIFLGCLDLYRGDDGTISSSFYCLGYSVPFTYTRGGNYCKIVIPDTTRLSFYIIAATASVNYSGGGMDTWTGYHRGSGAWWLHCYAFGWNEVRVKGFCQAGKNYDSWWGGNPLWNNEYGANRITVCIFGHVKYK